jgi:hypothetical protein
MNAVKLEQNQYYTIPHKNGQLKKQLAGRLLIEQKSVIFQRISDVH